MRASISFARTAGEGGRGIERARPRAREGVRVVVRAVEEALLSLAGRVLLAGYRESKAETV